jgi:hypothetical protein
MDGIYQKKDEFKSVTLRNASIVRIHARMRDQYLDVKYPNPDSDAPDPLCRVSVRVDKSLLYEVMSHFPGEIRDAAIETVMEKRGDINFGPAYDHIKLAEIKGSVLWADAIGRRCVDANAIIMEGGENG